MSHYVVAFRGGASGRFIANLVWMLINDLPINLTFTPENSAHDHNPWCVTWNEVIGAKHNNKDVYQKWEFNVADNGLFISHTYPDFTVLNDRLPDVKPIVITFSKDDLLEIATNMIYKNLVPAFRRYVIYEDRSELFEKVYKKEYDMYYLAHVRMYGKPMIINDTLLNNREFMDTMVYLKYDSMLKNYTKHEFFEANTIERDNTLVIKFADIFKNKDVLEQLKNFTNADVSSDTQNALDDAYTRYVNNRVEFLNNNLPIEKYEDYEKRRDATLVSRYGWSAS